MAFGDPFLLKASDGKYYMYGTGGVSNGFEVYSSDDLVTWTDEGPIYQGGTSDSWATDCFWAPEVYERDGKYYLCLLYTSLNSCLRTSLANSELK